MVETVRNSGPGWRLSPAQRESLVEAGLTSARHPGTLSWSLTHSCVPDFRGTVLRLVWDSLPCSALYCSPYCPPNQDLVNLGSPKTRYPVGAA